MKRPAHMQMPVNTGASSCGLGIYPCALWVLSSTKGICEKAYVLVYSLLVLAQRKIVKMIVVILTQPIHAKSSHNPVNLWIVTLATSEPASRVCVCSTTS